MSIVIYYLYSPFFFSSKCSLFHNANFFGSGIIHILYTGCVKLKKNNFGAKGLTTTLEGVRCQRHVPAYFTPGKDPVPIVQEAGWNLGPVWAGEENLASTGIRFPDHPARSQSLYRLSYRASHNIKTHKN